MIIEEVLGARYDPDRLFVPMKQEVDEDRDLEELVELINSKSDLVVKLRHRPEMLSKAKCQIIGGDLIFFNYFLCANFG